MSKIAEPTRGPILRLVGLHKSFDSLKVLSDVSLDFEAGQTTVILGPSGTGKSVLLKHIVGLLRPDRGEVWFDGQRIDQMSAPQLVAPRKKIGFLFQMGALFDSMNVRENICFPLVEHANLSYQEQSRRCASVLKAVGLEGIEKKCPLICPEASENGSPWRERLCLNPRSCFTMNRQPGWTRSGQM